MTFRPMPILSILMIPGLIVLVLLGTWQWQRYGEKLNAADGIGLTETYQIEASPLEAPLQSVYSTYDGDPVWRVFQPFTGCLTDEAGNEECRDDLLLVDLGLVQGFEPDPRLLDRVGRQPLSGRYRIVPDGRRTVLTPDDIPERDLWYTANAELLGQHLGLAPGVGVQIMEPETITQFALAAEDIVSRQIPNPYVSIANLDDLPPARHLGYALTWFGLALGMIGVYIALHMARGRLRFS